MRPHALVVRLDSAGDVLLSGPAVRAVAAGAAKVTYLCGPRGHAAAALLPGIDDIVVHRAAWIDPEPEPVARGELDRLVDDTGADEIMVSTVAHGLKTRLRSMELLAEGWRSLLPAAPVDELVQGDAGR